MNEGPQDYWQTLLNRMRELAEKASTQRLSKAEEEELIAEYKSRCLGSHGNPVKPRTRTSF
jgi:hypothetical protein